MNLVMIEKTVIRKQSRGIGHGKSLNQELIELAKEKGYKKISAQIYTQNLANVILKLKLGYEIEGRKINHDMHGVNEYDLSLEL